MKNTHKALLVVALAVSPLVLQAEGIPFESIDTDNNGLISSLEFNTAKTNRIRARSEEGRQMRGLANAPIFANLDTNHDGQLTPEEMKQMKRRGNGNKGQGNGKGRPPKPIFADFDINKDDSITEKEFNDARNARIGERAKEGRKMKGLANMPTFANIDTNADGRIIRDEFASFMLGHEKKGH